MNLSTSSSKPKLQAKEYRKLPGMLVFFAVPAVLLFLLQLATQYGIEHTTQGEVGKINGLMNHTIDTEIAIFGSSVAQVHFDPAIITAATGKKSFNFGIDGTTLAQYHGLLSEFLQYSDVEIIVLAGGYGELAVRDQIYELYKFSHHLDKPNVYNSLYPLDPELVWRTKHVPLYGYIIYNKDYYLSAWRGWQEYFSDRKDFQGKRGYEPQDKTWAAAPAKENTTGVEAEIDPKNVALYRQIIQEINIKGKKAVLVLTPIFAQQQHNIRNMEKLRSIYKELAGTENYFFDFTQSNICQRKDFFYNNTHLNRQGASMFSQEFAKRLQKLTN
ncbi:hypothetical protein [Pontibacter beigongshangensis]|uniref:hypothetical protein n=1 Tax=Pontibacter beigongshangensis TaxID=2574733 RepID=UPI001650AD76|nr:hypothetical protein [Pontibacter beigongshangensis]